MRKDGIEEPNYKFDAHHIVPHGDKYEFASKARDILKKNDIDINSSFNGVDLPSAKHPYPFGEKATKHQRHAKTYTEEVYNRLKAVENGNRQDIIDVLNQIKIDLLNGDLRLGRK